MRPVHLLALLPLALATGCSDPCQEASDRIAARYEECGFEVSEEEQEDAESECTDKEGEEALCVADCMEAADCAAFDGTDPDAAMAYSNCAVACVSS